MVLTLSTLTDEESRDAARFIRDLIAEGLQFDAERNAGETAITIRFNGGY